jgi:hypothetical protein
MNDEENRMAEQSVPGLELATKNEMPDLSHLFHRIILTHMLNRLGGRGPTRGVANVLFVNFIRLVDKSLAEYRLAREALSEWVSTSAEHVSPLFRTVDHLETCINTLHRAMTFAARIRSNQDCPDLPKQRSVFSSDAARKIREVRDCLEHFDNDILAGKLPPTAPSILVPRDDCFELLGKKVTYAELASWITQLHAIASSLAHYSERT